MNQFYLNDCLGSKSYSCADLSAGMVKVVKAFTFLARASKLRIDKGWILEKEPARIILGGVSLQEIVNNMRDKECRKLFYIYSVHHPIHQYFPLADEDTLLKAGYCFGGADATNIAIAYENHGILLSLPVLDELRVDYLTIESGNECYDELKIPNLHGNDTDNVKAIEHELLDRNYQVVDGLAKLECLAPKVYFSPVFRRRFIELTTNDKKSIYDRLDEARKGNMLQPLTCNGTIIKHVAPHVAELRIVNPVDIRVYFHESGEAIYFAKVEFKSTYKDNNDQNADIEHAESIVNSMM